MDKLIDTTYLRANFDIHSDVVDSRLVNNIGAASRRLRSWVTDEVYQSVLNAAAGDDKKEDFKLCEANLAMHYATLGMNTPVTSKGIIKSAKSKDSAVLTYFTPDEIAQVRQMYLEQAEEIIRSYKEFIDSVALTIVGDDPLICIDGFCQS